MKAATLMILIALVVSVVVPLSDIRTPADGKFLMALDVCDAANPTVSADSAMPGIHVCPGIIRPAGFAGFIHQADVLFRPLLMTVQKDRPPQF
jgi:hypothetical protein